MKNISTVFIVVIFGIIACNQPAKGRNGVTYKSAVQYNDYIVSRQTKLMQNVLDFSQVADKNIDSAGKMLDGYVSETTKIIEEIKGMPSYKGDSSLRDAAVRSFSFYKRVFQDDYSRIIMIREKGADMTSADIKEMQDIVGKITREEEGYDKSFHNAQKNFADRNNMKLMENKLQK